MLARRDEVAAQEGAACVLDDAAREGVCAALATIGAVHAHLHAQRAGPCRPSGARTGVLSIALEGRFSRYTVTATVECCARSPHNMFW